MKRNLNVLVYDHEMSDEILILGSKLDIISRHGELKKEIDKARQLLLAPELRQERLNKQLRPVFDKYKVYEKIIPFQIEFYESLTLDVIQYIQLLFCENMCQVKKAIFLDSNDRCNCEGDNLEIDHENDIYVKCTKCQLNVNKHTTYDGVLSGFKDVCKKCLVKIPDPYIKDYEACIIS